MQKKVLLLVALCASASFLAHGADLQSAVDGYWDDPATWAVESLASNDNYIVNGHYVTITNVLETGTVQSYGGTLDMQPGAGLSCYVQHMNGNLLMTNGASLHSTGSSIFGQVGVTTNTMNGGTALFDSWLLMKSSPVTFNLNTGSSLTTVSQLAFEGSGTATVFVNSGAELTVDWVHFQAGGTYAAKIVVTGGVFNVTTDNPTGSFHRDSTNGVVWVENEGMIVWQGLTNETQVAPVIATVEGWIDEGRVDSITWTDAKLKEGLRSFNGDVYLDPSFNLYLDWAASHGLTNSPNFDYDYDYDNDGQVNLIEYAFEGGDPTNVLVLATNPTFKVVGGACEYVHSQRTDDSELNYYLELTDDLLSGSWTNSGYTVVTNVTGGTFDYVTNQIPTTASEKFIKLNVQRP